MRAIYIVLTPSIVAVLAGCGGQAMDSGDPVGTASEPLAVAVDTAILAPLVQEPVLRLPLQTEGLITFDDVPSGTLIGSTYEPDVTFSALVPNGQNVIVSSPNVYALADVGHVPAVSCSTTYVTSPPSCTPSGNDVTIAQPPALLPEYSGRDGGVKAVFATPKTWVGIMAKPYLGIESLGPVTNEPFIEAFDPSGNYLGETLYPYAYGTPQWGSWENMVLTAPAGTTIGSIIFATQANSVSSAEVFAEFDNLSYYPPAGSIFAVDSSTRLFSFSAGGASMGNVAVQSPIGDINGGGIAYANGDLYVTIGQFTNTLNAYSLNLQPATLAAGAFPGLSVPRGIAYDPLDNQFFVGNGAASVNAYTAAGVPVPAAFPGHYGPSGVAYDSDDNAIWVANYAGFAFSGVPTYGVSEYSPNGALEQTMNYATQFVAPGPHDEPYSIAVCPKAVTGGTTAVVVGFIDDGTHLGNGAVQAYTTRGAPIGAPFGGPIAKPYAVSCDAYGDVYIADETGLYRGSISGQNMGLPGAFSGLTPPIYGVFTAP